MIWLAFAMSKARRQVGGKLRERWRKLALLQWWARLVQVTEAVAVVGGALL